jgi:hypothetical protein
VATRLLLAFLFASDQPVDRHPHGLPIRRYQRLVLGRTEDPDAVVSLLDLDVESV